MFARGPIQQGAPARRTFLFGDRQGVGQLFVVKLDARIDFAQPVGRDRADQRGAFRRLQFQVKRGMRTGADRPQHRRPRIGYRIGRNADIAAAQHRQMQRRRIRQRIDTDVIGAGQPVHQRQKRVVIEIRVLGQDRGAESGRIGVAAQNLAKSRKFLPIGLDEPVPIPADLAARAADILS